MDKKRKRKRDKNMEKEKMCGDIHHEGLLRTLSSTLGVFPPLTLTRKVAQFVRGYFHFAGKHCLGLLQIR